jgi:hypothetical protein
MPPAPSGLLENSLIRHLDEEEYRVNEALVPKIRVPDSICLPTFTSGRGSFLFENSSSRFF